MKRHLAYLKYVLIHKWWVLYAGLKIGAPIRALIMHDLSKFTPSEWFAYAHTFYDAQGNQQFAANPKFDEAWELHQQRNPHHWEFWDIGTSGAPQEMPHPYILEMVADWAGAGRAIKGEWDISAWYADTVGIRRLHPTTEAVARDLVRKLDLKLNGGRNAAMPTV